MLRLIVDTYEPTRPNVPVVRHTFFGATQEEALAYLKAHLVKDAALRTALEKMIRREIVPTSWVTVVWEHDPLVYAAHQWPGARHWPGEGPGYHGAHTGQDAAHHRAWEARKAARARMAFWNRGRGRKYR